MNNELAAVRRQYNELVRTYQDMTAHLVGHSDPALLAQLFQIQIQMHQATVTLHLLNHVAQLHTLLRDEEGGPR